jgi:urea carboxylase-associated protein 1
MIQAGLVASVRDAATAAMRAVVAAGEAWLHPLQLGDYLRIVDLEGNQAVDTLFFNSGSPAERYSATDTIRNQAAVYLTAGSQLMSTLGRPMLTIVADTCGRHDTLGGACSAESNTVRYALDKRDMHSCRDNFLLALQRAQVGLDKRDLTSNINFFMNVPVSAQGELSFADGVSGPGRYVELRAEMPVLVLISNCPQLNNPCNAWNPTPIELLVWKAA